MSSDAEFAKGIVEQAAKVSSDRAAGSPATLEDTLFDLSEITSKLGDRGEVVWEYFVGLVSTRKMHHDKLDSLNLPVDQPKTLK